jgi:hypothetical protein
VRDANEADGRPAARDPDRGLHRLDGARALHRGITSTPPVMSLIVTLASSPRSPTTSVAPNSLASAWRSA